MNSLLSYGIQVIIISGLLYSYYHFVLRNKKFHRYNRFYLLGAALLSILIPLLNIPVYFTADQADSSIVYNTLTVLSGSSQDEGVIVYATRTGKENWFTTTHILQLIYITIAAVVFMRIVFSLLKINRIIRRHPAEKIDNIHFLNTEEPGTPFSFFRWLFWNRQIELNSAKGEQIFRHELFHIEQKHSLDILFFELLTVVGWFNPFFHLMKRETKAIHEFLADQFAVTENNRWDYAELLLMQVLNTNQRLVHPFFHNQIKRRIAMITSPQKTSHQYMRKLMVLPVTALAVILFAFSYKNSSKPDIPALSQEKHTVVIDISHGGTDLGAVGPGAVFEKDLVFAIAQKIRSLNSNEQLNILFTRNEDKLPEMKYRTSLGKEQEADLFLSLHINSSPDKTKSGIEIFIPGRPDLQEKSRILGSIMAKQLAAVYTSRQQLLQRNKAIPILENSSCPSALLQIGYMSNEEDLNFIRDLKNQEAIAENILKSIEQYLAITEDDKKKDHPAIDTTGQPGKEKFIEVPVGQNTQIKSVPIFFKNKAENTVSNLENAMLIINGKQSFRSKLQNKLIESDSVVVYSPGDKEATRLYGASARNGVIIFYNARITDRPAPAEVTEENKIFTKVEIEAEFPGGMNAWRDYLQKNLDGSVPVRNHAPVGNYTVVMQFIVKLDGTISDIRPLTHHGYGMEDEVKRIINKGPKWKPAIQNGREIVAYRNQPVTFVVGKGDKQINTPTNSKNQPVIEEVKIELAPESIIPVEPAGKNLVFDKVEVEPGFPGGESKWREYLQRNLNGNIPVDSGAPAGKYTVMIQFIVDKDGYLSQIMPLTHHGYGMEKEVLRIIKNGPRWVPAIQNGRNVNAYKKQPVTFVIEEEADETGIPPAVSQKKQPSHILTVKELKNIDVYRLLQLPDGTEIISYVFTIDGDRDAIEVTNTGSQINQKTRELLNNAIAGKMITVDMIRIRAWDEQKKEFYIKKIPSVVWYVKD